MSRKRGSAEVRKSESPGEELKAGKKNQKSEEKNQESRAKSQDLEGADSVVKKSQEPRVKNQDLEGADSAPSAPHSEIEDSSQIEHTTSGIEHLTKESFGPTSEIANKSEPDSYRVEHLPTESFGPKSEIGQPFTLDSYRDHNSPLANMEVHHHPEVEKKGLKEYLLEGLMIFLAVTMGFYAETIREGISENHAARDYAESMREDLKKDTAELNARINEIKFVSSRLDTLVELVHTKKISDLPGGVWYYYGRFGSRYNYFQSANATLEQLKSSGALRYFRNYTIVNAIAQYDQSSRNVLYIVGNSPLESEAVGHLRNELFDAYYFIPVMDLKVSNRVIDSFKKKKIPLLDDDPKLMKEYANYCQVKSFQDKFTMSLELNLLAKAKELLNILDKEYKFK